MVVITVCVPDEAARDGLHPIPDEVRVLVWDGRGAPPDGVADTEFLLGGYMAAPEDVFAALPALRVVQLMSAGFEVWLPHLPAGVTLCNGRGIHGRATAELAVAGILALVRQLPLFLTQQAERRWAEKRTEDLDRKRVLVLGAGDIGTHIARALEVFGTTTTYVARSARDGVRALADLPALLPETDILAVAVPLNEQTRGLVDAAALAALPDGAIVANVARGAIVDTAALTTETAAGRLRAFLDVTEPEPLPADHPLWTTPGVVITPHVGGGTHGWQRRAYALVRSQIERYLAGEPLQNVVEAP